MESLKTFLKEFNWRVNGRLFGFGTSSKADWKNIFISTIILAILTIILSVFIFIKIDKGEIFVEKKTAEPEKQILDLSLLRETVSYYQNKALEFERIKNAKVDAVDPSL